MDRFGKILTACLDLRSGCSSSQEMASQRPWQYFCFGFWFLSIVGWTTAPSPPPPQPSSALPPAAGPPTSSAPPGSSHSAAGLALLSLARRFPMQLAFFLIPHRVLWLVGQVINR